jgi:hypothetical protein
METTQITLFTLGDLARYKPTNRVYIISEDGIFDATYQRFDYGVFDIIKDCFLTNAEENKLKKITVNDLNVDELYSIKKIVEISNMPDNVKKKGAFDMFVHEAKTRKQIVENLTNQIQQSCKQESE